MQRQLTAAQRGALRYAADVARARGRTPVKWSPFEAPTLGVAHLTVCGFLDRVGRELTAARMVSRAAPPGRILDSVVEAHVHGAIELSRDVEQLVMDPAFQGSPTSRVLTELCERYGISLHSHCGFRMPIEAVPDDFRGPRMRPLARRITRDGFLDATMIGNAEASLHRRAEDWEDWGDRDETLQH